jgi:hypothetical protein
MRLSVRREGSTLVTLLSPAASRRDLEIFGQEFGRVSNARPAQGTTLAPIIVERGAQICDSHL